MKDIIETLYPMNRCLLGEGFDNAIEYLKHLIDLDVIEVPSGQTFGTWTVPDEWVVRDAYVKFNGEKIIDYKTQPLSLVVGSLPFQGEVTKEELEKHLHFSEDLPSATPYVFKYYDKDWGFCAPKSGFRNKVEGSEHVYESALTEGTYEVFIDTEYRPGKLKIGVHTIPGKSDREILLFAHLDHPFQANDNLSAVACLVDLATKIKCDHTVKVILCAETLGSTVYANLKDVSKVDFVIAVDICGNDNSLLLQKSFDKEARINRVAHVAINVTGESHRKSLFRTVIGSDEYAFNDPLVGIPGLLLSRYPYREYHTSEDTPDKINYEMIEKTQNVILKIIEVYEKDYIPTREFKGPLMRSRYGTQTANSQLNLSFDYFFYAIDGKRSLAELCCDYGINFDYAYDLLDKMKNDGYISAHSCEEALKPTSRKKPKGLPRKGDVGSQHGKKSPYF